MAQNQEDIRKLLIILADTMSEIKESMYVLWLLHQLTFDDSTAFNPSMFSLSRAKQVAAIKMQMLDIFENIEVKINLINSIESQTRNLLD